MDVWRFLESLKNIVANVNNWIGIIFIKNNGYFFLYIMTTLISLYRREGFFFPQKNNFWTFQKKSDWPQFFLVGINEKWKRI